MNKILHSIRFITSFVPGGQTLIQRTLRTLAARHNRKCQKLLQSCGLIIYGKIHDILSAANVKYFADHGTLLGLIRENGVIAHDVDMDFSIPPGESLFKVYNALTKHGFTLDHGFACNGEIVEVTFYHMGLTMDFFKCHRIGENLGHYVFVTRYDPKTGNYSGVIAHERIRPSLQGIANREFGTTTKTTVSIPVNAIEYLAASYGNWKIPDSKTDFSSAKIPTQYRDITEGCELLSTDRITKCFNKCSDRLAN